MPKAKQVLYRTALLERDTTEGAGTACFALSFASELPVKRRDSDGNFYWEVLSHAPGDANLGFLNRAGMVLQDHNEKKEIGDVIKGSAKVDADKKSRARIKLFAEQKDWQTRAATDPAAIPVSVGYDPMSIVSEEVGPENIPLLRFAWRPFEVSLLTVAPADDTVGINRQAEPALNLTRVKRRCEECRGTGRCRCRAKEDDDADDSCEDCNGKGLCSDCGGNGYFSSARTKKVDQFIPLVDFVQSTNADDIAANLTAEQKQRMKNILLKDDGNGGTGGGGGGTATITPEEVAKKETAARSAGVTEGRTALLERNRQIGDIVEKVLKGNERKLDDKGLELQVKLRQLEREAMNAPEMTVGDFQTRVMKEIFDAKPAKVIGIEDCTEDPRRYSLARAIASAIKNGEKEGCNRAACIPADGCEREVHDEMIKKVRAQNIAGYAPSGLQMPYNALTRITDPKMARDLQATIFPSGGAIVATELYVPIIELLRNKTVLKRLGVREMPGLSSNVVIPRQTAPATAYSVGEIDAITSSQLALDQIPLNPKRLGVLTKYSKQLLIQATPAVEALVRDDAFKTAAIKSDYLGLNGGGAGNEPTGVWNTVGIGSITFGGSVSYANLLTMQQDIRQANVDGPLKFLTSVPSMCKLQGAAVTLTGATTVIGGAPNALWLNGEDDGRLLFYPALASMQVPNNQMAIGEWDQLIWAMWGGLDWVVDIYTLADKGEVRLILNLWQDFAVRHPQAFVVSADAANQ